MLKHLILFIFALYSLYTCAQSNTFWMNFTYGKWIRDVAYDGDTVWCATYGGVAKVIPGTGEVTLFNASNSALNNNNIERVVVDQNHNKWFGTKKGLIRLSGSYWTHYHSYSIAMNPISEIEADPNGDIWFLGINPSTQESGLIRFDGSAFQTMDSTNTGLPNNQVTKITKDKTGNLWFIAGNAIVRFDGTSWVLVDNSNPSLFNLYPWGFCIDINNRVWLTANSAVLMFDGVSWDEFDIYNSPLVFSSTTGIAADDSGRVWICNNKRLFRTDGINWTVFDSSNSPAAEHLFFECSLDAGGNLWAGTWRNGLYRYSFTGNQWTHYQTTNSGLGYQIIEQLALGKNDEVWIINSPTFILKQDTLWTSFDSLPPNVHQLEGMAVDTNNVFWGGLYYGGGTGPGPIAATYDGSQWSFANFNTAYTIDITVDRDNNKWFGTGTDGLIKFDGTTWTTFNVANSPLADDFVMRVYADRNNNIWVATPYGAGGLQKISGSNWENFNLAGLGFPGTNAVSMVEDYTGNLFVTAGWSQRKIGKYNAGTWTFLNGLPGNFASALAIDHNNNLWVGFWDAGLAKYDGSNWVVYNVSNSGLPDNQIFDIKIDRYNNKWISTAYGGLALFNEYGINFTTPAAERMSVGGSIYYDQNGNGQHNGNEPFLNQQVVFESSDSITQYTNSVGEYSFYLLAGNYHMAAQPYSNWFVSGDSASYNVTVDSTSISGLDFGLSADPFRQYNLDLNSGVNRCGFVVPYWIHYRNTGSMMDSGYIQFIRDTSCVWVNAVPTPDTVIGNIYRWNFSSLIPYHDRSVSVQLLIPNVPGDSVHQHASLHYYDSGIPVQNVTASIDDEIACAVDPNDKRVIPAGLGPQHLTWNNDTLQYIIRFQNVGNDTAFFIRVVDTLNSNLNPQSVQVVSASHPYSMTNQNGLLVFDFPVANLPPSALNEAASNGYIRFRVTPKDGLSNYTLIENKACIYFNFNDAINTNIVLNILVDSLILTDGPDMDLPEEIQIYPNPITSQAVIRYPNPHHLVFKTELIDLLGETVWEMENSSGECTISKNNLPPGVYFIQATSARIIYRKKLIIN